jgi:hypothetical protein
MLGIVLVVGVLLGGTASYLLFNGKTVTITTLPQATASPSPSATAVATPSAVASEPVVTPESAAVGVVPCPAATPTGQHQLGTPGNPGAGQTQSPSLDFCGGGNAVIPTGTTRFTTNSNWGLGVADSCPVGSSGEGGMNTVLTITELLVGGGQGPDSATEGGDFVDSGSVLMRTGGNFQLQVTTVVPGCVWHINIYPTP